MQPLAEGARGRGAARPDACQERIQAVAVACRGGVKESRDVDVPNERRVDDAHQHEGVQHLDAVSVPAHDAGEIRNRIGATSGGLARGAQHARVAGIDLTASMSMPSCGTTESRTSFAVCSGCSRP